MVYWYMYPTRSRQIREDMSNRSPKAEAKRKLTQAETMYERMLEKQHAARVEYREKIARLRADYEATPETEPQKGTK